VHGCNTVLIDIGGCGWIRAHLADAETVATGEQFTDVPLDDLRILAGLSEELE